VSGIFGMIFCKKMLYLESKGMAPPQECMRVAAIGKMVRKYCEESRPNQF
jgi:hypothetical protein